MTGEGVIVLITLVVYQALLLAIGWWANQRTRDSVDFFLGGRALGGFVAAISASASSSSAWTLLGVSGSAFLWGLSALWLFPATLGGFLINWVLIAPALRRLAQQTDAVTLTDVVAAFPQDDGRRSLAVARTASVIVLVSFGFYVAAQFQAAGAAFDSQFGLDASLAIVIGALIVVLYTLAGGFWAVSVTDSVQGLLMAVTAVMLPVGGLFAVGGPEALLTGLADDGDLFGNRALPAALGFVAGTLGIGLGYPGQPHVLNRFMALRDDRALRDARVVAITWAVVVYSGMLVTGWCARLLLAPQAGSAEGVFYAMTGELFPPVVAGVMLAAVLSAIMSTADSQLLVAASSVSHDLRRRGTRTVSLLHSRLVVLGLSVFALALALFAPQSIFARVLFAWHAVGSAFGPLVVAALVGHYVPVPVRLVAMICGAGLTVLAHWLSESPGDVVERLGPLAVSALVVWLGPRLPIARAGAPPGP